MRKKICLLKFMSSASACVCFMLFDGSGGERLTECQCHSLSADEQAKTHTHTHKIEMATRRSALQRRGLYSGHFSHRTPKYWRSTGDAGDYNDTRTAESLSQKDFSIFSRVHKFLPNLWCRSLMRNQLARARKKTHNLHSNLQFDTELWK